MTGRDAPLVRAARATDLPVPGHRRWGALTVLGTALFLIGIDATVLNLALPALTRDLQPSSTELLWILDAYSLVLAGLLVTMGSLGVRWGRRRTLLVGVLVFGGASVLAAFAPSTGVLIVARALLGVGGAMMMPSTLSIIRNIFTDRRERALAIAIWGAIASAGAAAGPIVGGALLEHFSWGSVFLINVPVMAVVLLAGRALIPESRDERPGPWDLPSAVASMIGVAALMYAVKELSVYGPGDPRALGAGAVGGALLTWFVWRQTQLTQPLLDVSLFRLPAFAGAAICNVVALFGLSGMLFLLSQLFQLVLGYAPLEAGLRLLPGTIGSLAVAPLAARLLHRAGPRVAITLGLGCAASGLLILAGADVHGSYSVLAVALAMIGGGAALAMTASSDTIVGTAPAASAGGAAAISEAGYELGTALGVAILGSVMNAVYRSQIVPVTGVDAEGMRLAASSLASATEVAQQIGGGPGATLLALSQNAFLAGMDVTFMTGGCTLLLSALLAWWLLPGRPAMGASQSISSGGSSSRLRLGSARR